MSKDSGGAGQGADGLAGGAGGRLSSGGAGGVKAAGGSAGGGGARAGGAGGAGGEDRTSAGGVSADGCVIRNAGEWRLTSTVGEPPPNALNNPEIVLWSGKAGFVLRYGTDGGKYDPCTDSWTRFEAYRHFTSLLLTSEVGAYAVLPGTDFYATEFSFFDFAKLTWRQLSVAGYPTAADRDGAAVLVESQIVRWGGTAAGGFPYRVLAKGGAVYDINRDQWKPMSNVGAPAERVIDRNVIAAGKQVFVWGGARIPGRSGTIQPDDASAAALTQSSGLECPNWEPENCAYGDGASYDPLSDRWTAVSQTGAPSARFRATIAWTGSRVLVWGGERYVLRDRGLSHQYLTDGALYDPVANSWTPMAGAPALPANALPGGIWANGHLRLVDGSDGTNPGYLYDPARNVWEPAPPAPSMPKRQDGPISPTVVWTGSSWFAMGGFRLGATPPNTCNGVPGCDPLGPEIFQVAEAAMALPVP